MAHRTREKRRAAPAGASPPDRASPGDTYVKIELASDVYETGRKDSKTQVSD
jgi:hypothetical protein